MSETTIFLDYRAKNVKGNLSISGSKSESNRWLILQKLYGNIQINNLSDAEDTQLLQKALLSKNEIIDINHAGTAMRFLTSYFATIERKNIVLTGSSRMKNRPIKILVDALISLGAEIKYLEKEGFPPINIIGKKFQKNKVAMEGNISSQYISSLLLIAPSLPNGLVIEFVTEITSIPYLNMTITQLRELGISILFEDNIITVHPFDNIKKSKLNVEVESDWSSASYFYSAIALCNRGDVTLSSFHKRSKQGDSELSNLYKLFGVKTIFKDHKIHLTKDPDFIKPELINLNLIDSPDIAQTIAVTCLGLEINCVLTGLHTLKIKETDRLQALKNELEKFGAQVIITNDSLQLITSKHLNSDVEIETYHDHRMAMSFAPLSLKTSIKIKDFNVVKKSYPMFWNDFQSLFS